MASLLTYIDIPCDFWMTSPADLTSMMVCKAIPELVVHVFSMGFPQISGVFSVPRLQLSTLRPALGVAQMHQLFTLRAAWLREIPGLLVELLMGKIIGKYWKISP